MIEPHRARVRTWRLNCPTTAGAAAAADAEVVETAVVDAMEDVTEATDVGE